MSGTKAIIDSVEKVINPLNISNLRMGIVSSGEIPFDSITQGLIPSSLSDILLKKSEADTANSNSIGANAAYDLEMAKLRKYQNSYFTIIFLKIKDGIYAESILTSFGIPTNSRALPYNDSDIACINLVAKMKTGNDQIIALSLPLMVDYNYAQANTYLGVAEGLKGTKISMDSIANAKDTALVVSYTSGKALVEGMEAQEDLFYRLLKDGTFRDALRDWGVVFEADKPITELSVKAKFAVSGLDANGATFHIGKALTARGKIAKQGVTATILANGVVVLSTTQEGVVVLTGKCVGCVDINQPVTIVPGTNQAFAFAFVLV
jgi:hypothetical protein